MKIMMVKLNFNSCQFQVIDSLKYRNKLKNNNILFIFLLNIKFSLNIIYDIYNKMSYTIDIVLFVDKLHRINGIFDDLYKISDIQSDKTLDYKVPILCNSKSNYQNTLLDSLTIFKKKFYEKYAFLKRVDLKQLVIAGGCISNIVRDYYHNDSDIDFFIYDLNPLEATQRVEKWISEIVSLYNSENESEQKNESEQENKSDHENDKKINDYKIIKK